MYVNDLRLELIYAGNDASYRRRGKSYSSVYMPYVYQYLSRDVGCATIAAVGTLHSGEELYRMQKKHLQYSMTACSWRMPAWEGALSLRHVTLLARLISRSCCLSHHRE